MNYRQPLSHNVASAPRIERNMGGSGTDESSLQSFLDDLSDEVEADDEHQKSLRGHRLDEVGEPWGAARVRIGGYRRILRLPTLTLKQKRPESAAPLIRCRITLWPAIAC